MAYGSSYASEGRELPRLLLILVGGAAHELAHGLDALIFLLYFHLRGSDLCLGTPPPRPLPQETAGTPAPRLLLARLADAYGTTVRVARHDDLVADKN